MVFAVEIDENGLLQPAYSAGSEANDPAAEPRLGWKAVRIPKTL